MKIPFCFIGGEDFTGGHRVSGHPTHVMAETSDKWKWQPPKRGQSKEGEISWGWGGPPGHLRGDAG